MTPQRVVVLLVLAIVAIAPLCSVLAASAEKPLTAPSTAARREFVNLITSARPNKNGAAKITHGRNLRAFGPPITIVQ